MYCYSNNGMSMRSVPNDYVAQKGEYLSPVTLDDSQKMKVIEGFEDALAKQDVLRDIAALEAQQTPRHARGCTHG